MENHPIPQDVTGFKFKLIGSVTIKQFLYLLGAGILTTITFVLPIPVYVKFPFMGLFAFVGLGLAFVPIEGRPMDTMIANFAKTIPSENEYIYRKRGVNLATYDFFKPLVQVATPQQQTQKATSESDTRRAILLSQLRAHYITPDQAETKFLKNIKSVFDETPKPKIQQEVKISTKTEEVAVAAPESSVLTATTDAAPTPTAPLEESESVRVVGPLQQLKAGFPTIPDTPNIVLGIVKDPRGRVLQNILVEVVDTSNVPVRAFKTNVLGQFASATPLPNGTYRVIFEDPQKIHEFEITEITLTGEIFNPLEAVSLDQRERLRRELFANLSTGTPSVQQGAAI